MSLVKSHHPIKHLKSFKYAFSGILHSLYHEANFRVQVVLTILATALGFYFQIAEQLLIGNLFQQFYLKSVSFLWKRTLC
jgi:diacylglycerol kinase